jgi:release factor glutamine methyltransferase
MSTVAEALKAAADELKSRSDSPRLDAELLLGHVLGKDRAALRAADEAPLCASRRGAFQSLVGRRAAGAPVAYLTGEREFWSLSLQVTPAVLVPRPETEILVECALERLPRNAPCAVLDLGTGSGAIAIALASERPEATVTGTDLSAPALTLAAANAARLGLSNLRWRHGSWFDAVRGERFDLIASNPPYIAAADPALAALAAEPALALTPGPSGLEAFAAIIAGAPAHLVRGGWLLLEHGAAQASEVIHLLLGHGFREPRTRADYAGLSRVTLATTH